MNRILRSKLQSLSSSKTILLITEHSWLGDEQSSYDSNCRQGRNDGRFGVPESDSLYCSVWTKRFLYLDESGEEGDITWSQKRPSGRKKPEA
jgi:hypothetical protein